MSLADPGPGRRIRWAAHALLSDVPIPLAVSGKSPNPSPPLFLLQVERHLQPASLAPSFALMAPLDSLYLGDNYIGDAGAPGHCQ